MLIEDIVSLEGSPISPVIIDILRDLSTISGEKIVEQLSSGVRRPSQVFVLCCSLIESALKAKTIVSKEFSPSELKVIASKLLIRIVTEWLHGQNIELKDFVLISVGVVIPDEIYGITRAITDSTTMFDEAISILIAGSRNANLLQNAVQYSPEIIEEVVSSNCFGFCTKRSSVPKREPVPEVTLETILRSVNSL